MAPRNRVKKRIVGDIWSFVSSPPQQRPRTARLGRPTAATMVSSEILSPSLAAGVDKSLDAGPALTRSNPTACILVKVPSADSLKHEGSRLYKDEKGDWVADLVPENTAEGDASSGTQMMGDRIDRPTPTML